jgi:hypothetical protein
MSADGAILVGVVTRAAETTHVAEKMHVAETTRAAEAARTDPIGLRVAYCPSSS